MDADKYSTMCLCRWFVLFLLVPSLVHSAEWPGKWFPENPNLRTLASTTTTPSTTTPSTTTPSTTTPTTTTSATTTTAAPPSSTEKVPELDIDNWTGKWFPGSPGSVSTTPMPTAAVKPNISMGLPDAKCDNAKDNLDVDFDPSNISDSMIYVCLANKHLYNPNITVEPVLKEHDISPAYRPLHKCMDTEINYEPGIPTFGDHRPLWARYGVYRYLPVQRWLHNIEHGAVVMLYHPCANFNQVEHLKMLVKNCLYRHIITPNSELLTPERPMALVAWGRSLEMSVVVPDIVIKFIKESALRGPEQTSTNGQYDKLLINRADIVSTIDDSDLCPNNPESMIV